VIYLFIKKEWNLFLNSYLGVAVFFVFSLLIAFISHFAWERSSSLSLETVRGLKWIAIFVSMYAIVSQNHKDEREWKASEIEASIVPRIPVYLTKSIFLGTLALFFQVILLLIYSVFFAEYTIESIRGEILFLIPGIYSFSFLANSIVYISMSTKNHDLAFPVLLLPLSVPIFLYCIRGEWSYFESGWNTKQYLVCFLVTIFYATMGSIFSEIDSPDS
jgi:heme exporter protein B